MTNKDLYDKFIKVKKENDITYRFLAKKLETSCGNIHDRIKRLKNNKGVSTDFLIKLENAINKKIFFD